MDRDVASALPEVPPPSPARRDAAIAAALAAYDGEPAAARTPSPKPRTWRVRPRGGTAIAAMLVLLIAVPTAWMSIHPPNEPEPEPRRAPAAVESAAEAPASQGQDAAPAEPVPVEPPAAPRKDAARPPSKPAAKPSAPAPEPVPAPPSPPAAPAIAEYAQQSADQARIAVRSQMRAEVPPAAAAPSAPAEAGNIVVTGSRVTAENKLARRSEGPAEPSRPIASGSSEDMDQLARMARRCGLRNWRIEKSAAKPSFYLDGAELGSEAGRCFRSRQARHRFSPEFAATGAIDAP